MEQQQLAPSLLDILWQELEEAFQWNYPARVVESIVNKNPRVLEHRYYEESKTPLQRAVELRTHYDDQSSEEFCNMIEFIVRKGETALTMACRDGDIPIHYACGNESVNLEVIQLLVNHYPDSIRVKDYAGRTPLQLAVHFGRSIEIIRFLFELYPEAAVETDNEGCTPLHTACSPNGDVTPEKEVIEFLLSRNSESMDVPDKEGWTPIHMMCHYDDDEDDGNLKEVLQIVYNACPEAARKQGKLNETFCNALYVACKCRFLPAVEFLVDINPCLVIVQHDQNKMSWNDFSYSINTIFEVINRLKHDNPQIYECVRHAAVSLVSTLIRCKGKSLSGMDDEVAEHLAGLLGSRPYPTLQELNTPDFMNDALVEEEIFQNLQGMLRKERFQVLLQMNPMAVQYRRGHENKAKAALALASVSDNSQLLFYQLRKNPLIIERSLGKKQKKRKHVETK